MIQKLKHILLGGVLTGVFAMGTLVVLTPTTVSAACNDRFLTMPAWYTGLTDGSCKMKPIPKTNNGLRDYILKIALNLIEILMQLVAYVAVAFLIWGGFLYMTAVGESGKLTNAKNTIRNAIVGLVISIAAVGIVSLISRNIM
ncbi:MAG: pilin [Candidatus Saccharimonadales bacterium]